MGFCWEKCKEYMAEGGIFDGGTYAGSYTTQTIAQQVVNNLVNDGYDVYWFQCTDSVDGTMWYVLYREPEPEPEPDPMPVYNGVIRDSVTTGALEGVKVTVESNVTYTNQYGSYWLDVPREVFTNIVFEKEGYITRTEGISTPYTGTTHGNFSLTPHPKLEMDIVRITPSKRNVRYGEEISVEIAVQNIGNIDGTSIIALYLGNEAQDLWWQYPDTEVFVRSRYYKYLTKYITIPANINVKDILVMVYSPDFLTKYDDKIELNALQVTPYTSPDHAQITIQNTGNISYSPIIGYSIIPESASQWKDAPLVTVASFSPDNTQTINTGTVNVPTGVHGRVYAWIAVYDPDNNELARIGGPNDTSVYFDVP